MLRQNQFFIAGILFLIAAAVTFLGSTQNAALAVMWLALAVAFLGIGWRQRQNKQP
jgi:uncharacterized membrane protein